jgi:hypothetical protein
MPSSINHEDTGQDAGSPQRIRELWQGLCPDITTKIEKYGGGCHQLFSLNGGGVLHSIKSFLYNNVESSHYKGEGTCLKNWLRVQEMLSVIK